MASTFLTRMAGAARLDARTYEEVEADVSANGQAVGVILLSSAASGVGLMLMRGGSADPLFHRRLRDCVFVAWCRTGPALHSEVPR